MCLFYSVRKRKRVKKRRKSVFEIQAFTWDRTLEGNAKLFWLEGKPPVRNYFVVFLYIDLYIDLYSYYSHSLSNSCRSYIIRFISVRIFRPNFNLIVWLADHYSWAWISLGALYFRHSAKTKQSLVNKYFNLFVLSYTFHISFILFISVRSHISSVIFISLSFCSYQSVSIRIYFVIFLYIDLNGYLSFSSNLPMVSMSILFVSVAECLHRWFFSCLYHSVPISLCIFRNFLSSTTFCSYLYCFVRISLILFNSVRIYQLCSYHSNYVRIYQTLFVSISICSYFSQSVCICVTLFVYLALSTFLSRFRRLCIAFIECCIFSSQLFCYIRICQTLFVSVAFCSYISHSVRISLVPFVSILFLFVSVSFLLVFVSLSSYLFHPVKSCFIRIYFVLFLYIIFCSYLYYCIYINYTLCPWCSWRCPWCSRYRRRKWTRRYEFKSWTILIAFHIALIPLGKVWIQLFSLQLWVNSRTD